MGRTQKLDRFEKDEEGKNSQSGRQAAERRCGEDEEILLQDSVLLRFCAPQVAEASYDFAGFGPTAFFRLRTSR